MNKAHRIDNYKFSDVDRLLFDANVWLYLLPAPSSSAHYATRLYSAAFKLMKEAGSNILINSMVLSEYLNRYCRIEWSALHRKTYPQFKDFRQSTAFASVGQNAAAYGKIILKNSTKVDDGFAGVDCLSMLGVFESGGADFNDAMISDLCSRNGWLLVTHDGDFTEGGINIVTGNNRLIAACSAPLV